MSLTPLIVNIFSVIFVFHKFMDPLAAGFGLWAVGLIPLV